MWPVFNGIGHLAATILAFFGGRATHLLDAGPAAMDNDRKPERMGHIMWVSKPIYESLPYFYLLVGAISLAASMYLNHWYWPTICFVVGLACLVGGLVVWLKRRDHRDLDRRGSQSREL